MIREPIGSKLCKIAQDPMQRPTPISVIEQKSVRSMAVKAAVEWYVKSIDRRRADLVQANPEYQLCSRQILE